MNISNSLSLYNQALAITPGGVHNPARSFRSVGNGSPLFIREGKGSAIYDEDGNEFIDYIMGWGVHILGHSDPFLLEKLIENVKKGVHFGTPSKSELELCQLLIECIPSLEMLRFVNSGSEAVMAAIKTARIFTGKEGIIKFQGCYHGWYEEMLVGSPYHPQTDNLNICVAPYNNLEEVQKILDANYKNLAALIIEPVAGNMGVISPVNGFLKGLRSLCDEYKVLLIFDEVMTGFRVAFGGAQLKYDVAPDMTCLGKIIGGGLPIGAYGGRREIMQCVAPLGEAYQGGTYSGNPFSTSAGLHVVKKLKEDQRYWMNLEKKVNQLCNGIVEIASRYGIPICANIEGAMFTLFFCDEPPFDYDSAKRSNQDDYAKFFQAMINHGIYWPPAQLEAAHLSLSHTEENIEFTIHTANEIMSNW